MSAIMRSEQHNVKTTGQWDETVDVAIIGSGFAGLCAAYEASQRATDVLVLEKMPYSGGNSRIAGGGYCCWDSKLKLREELGLGEDSWELHAQDTLAAGKGYNDPELVSILAQEAPLGLDLMVDAGIPFRKSLPRIGGHSAYRSYQTACTGSETLKKLQDHCLGAANGKSEAELRCNVTVTGLVIGENGSIEGVKVRTGKDADLTSEQRIRARRAVIIATGGYANDTALRMRYKPSLKDSYGCTNHRGATGEVIGYAREAGADVIHMEFVQLYPCANPKNGSIDQGAFLCFSGTGYGLIYVDGSGERFVNELAPREVVAQAQIDLDAKPTYAVLNDAIFRALGIEEETVEAMVRSGRLLKGESLDELARVADFDIDKFEATIEAHDSAIEHSAEAPFGKATTKNMMPLSDGAHYALAQWPAIHYCMGGLRIDADARVLDIQGNPIAGLYAAGECCGGVHGIDRLGGNGIAECMVFGLRAGKMN